jgi:hypothetical protein
MLYKPGIAIRILAGAIDQSQRMLHHLGRFFAHPALAGQLSSKPTANRVALKNGSQVEVLAQSQTSVRGTHVQKLRCDEVELFDPRVWEAAQFTTQSKDCGGIHVRGSVECLSTMHEPGGLMQQLVLEAQEGKRKLFRWGLMDVLEHCGPARLCQGWKADTPESTDPQSSDSSGGPPPQVPTITDIPIPLPILPYGSPAAPCPLFEECKGLAKQRPQEQAGHYRVEDAIATKGRVHKESWESEMLCLRPRRTNLAVPEFSRAQHVFNTSGPQGRVTWLVGMDFGMRSPTVVLWAALDDMDVLWIMDERYETDTILEEHALAIKAGLARPGIRAWPQPKWIAADPAARHINPQTGVSDARALQKHGYDIRTPISAVARGLGYVRARLGPAAGNTRLFIHERCANLIRSLECYRHDPKAPDNEPLKDGNDHAVDALRYLVLSIDHKGGDKWASYLGS